MRMINKLGNKLLFVPSISFYLSVRLLPLISINSGRVFEVHVATKKVKSSSVKENNTKLIVFILHKISKIINQLIKITNLLNQGMSKNF